MGVTCTQGIGRPEEVIVCQFILINQSPRTPQTPGSSDGFQRHLAMVPVHTRVPAVMIVRRCSNLLSNMMHCQNVNKFKANKRGMALWSTCPCKGYATAGRPGRRAGAYTWPGPGLGAPIPWTAILALMPSTSYCRPFLMPYLFSSLSPVRSLISLSSWHSTHAEQQQAHRRSVPQFPSMFRVLRRLERK